MHALNRQDYFTPKNHWLLFSFVANADQSGCGGILHGEQGNISAPLDDNGKYRNGIQCTWDIGKGKMPLKNRIRAC